VRRDIERKLLVLFQLRNAMGYALRGKLRSLRDMIEARIFVQVALWPVIATEQRETDCGECENEPAFHEFIKLSFCCNQKMEFLVIR